VSTTAIALTIGDPNGIGPEIAVKAAAQTAREAGPSIVLVGDEFVIRFYAERCAKDLAVELFNGSAPRAGTLCVLGVDALPRNAFCPGTPLAAGGRATVDYVSAAMRLVNEKHASSIVACPHSEANVNAAGIPFTGYPGLLARLSGIPEENVFLMLVGGGMRIVHVTLHERLHTALARITPELVERAARSVDSALRQLNVKQPRIGVFGINPHAGEAGHLGREEIDVIEPVIQELRAEGLDLRGPVPADTAFTPRFLETADVIVAMYHDQGLPVIKHVGFGNAVNMTLGLPILRTSVDHGTALSLARTGKADVGSLRAALSLAVDLAGTGSAHAGS